MQAKSEWIPVGALGEAFMPDNNSLPAIDDLIGKSLTLNFENGWTIRHDFSSASRLHWARIEGDRVVEENHEHYMATRPRNGIYFVDMIKSGERATSVSLVLDTAKQSFIAVIGQLPPAEESLIPLIRRIEQGKDLPAVSTTFLRGTIDRPFEATADLPAVTGELVGKRVEYTYSPFEKYEHIYLNERRYTWHCLDGSEKGLADTDACDHYRIGDRLYLFVWREKVIPTLGIIMVDLEAMKTTGKIMGYEANDFGAIRNFDVGARVRVLPAVPVE